MGGPGKLTTKRISAESGNSGLRFQITFTHAENGDEHRGTFKLAKGLKLVHARATTRFFSGLHDRCGGESGFGCYEGSCLGSEDSPSFCGK